MVSEIPYAVVVRGHSFNSPLDYAWTGLDKGTAEERSAGKDCCGGQSVLAEGAVTTREVALNAVVWCLLGAIPIVYLVMRVGRGILLVGILGSVAYEVWESGLALEWYLTSWLLSMFLYQGFLIAIGIIAPLTALSVFAWPFLIGTLVLHRRNLRRMAKKGPTPCRYFSSTTL